MGNIIEPCVGARAGVSAVRPWHMRLTVMTAFAVMAFLAATAPAARAACTPPAGANEIVVENCKAGNPSSEWDVSGAGDREHPGLRHRHQRQPGRDGRVQDRHARATDYRLDIYRMGYYGGDGARQVATVQPSAALPQTSRRASPTARHGPGRLRQLGRVGVVGGARRRGLRHLLRQARAHGRHRRRRATSSSSSATTTATRTCSSRPPTRPGRPTTTTAATASTPAARRGPGRAYKVSYNRPFTHARGRRRRGLGLQRRVPDGALAGAQRLRRQLRDRRRHRPLRRRSANHRLFLSVGPRRVLVRRRSAPTSRRPATRASTSPSSAATRSSGRRAGRTDSPPRSVSYKETHASAKIDPSGHVDRDLARPAVVQPARAARPENALTGTIFMVNSGTTAIQVPAEDGKLRLWRDTTWPRWQPATTATLAGEHARLRVGRGRRQRRSTRRAGAPVLDHGRRRRASSRTTARATGRAPRRTT